MFPILILRSEAVCLIILIFLFFTSRSYNIDRESRIFRRILFFAVFHVIFDAVTVLTVNHVDTVPLWLNWTCHAVFYITAILYSNEIANYAAILCYPHKAKKLYAAGHLCTLLYAGSLAFLPIEYVEDVGTYSSAGPAAIVGYGLAFSFFIAALVIMFTHMNKMTTSIKSALIPMMVVLMVTEISQVMVRSILFTGGAITIVTVGLFFSLENPVEVFKKKAMTDALTGVRSRRSYEEDMEKADKSFREDPDERYIFVFCDLNDLRSVNNRFGHAEGDNYITLIATAISRCMKHSAAHYRIGGDEFLIVYTHSDEETVEREIGELQAACAEASEALEYTAAIAVGYARSSESYKTLRDVVKTADYAMYQNKMLIKAGDLAVGSLGTKLNYAGLTDKMFDALCASSDKIYPYLTNLETNVTRIDPGWKEYFGLDSEFYADFAGYWKDRIHPDDYDGYMQDIISVLNGHKKYHNYDYFAKKADGEYVRVSCHGSVYKDNSTGTSYFVGFIENHGLDDNTDPLTGLRNFDELNSVVYKHMDEGKPFSVIKLKLGNFARVNMLYGYDGGNTVIRNIAEILQRELTDGGQVFCYNSVNFSILFETDDERVPENYYKRISELCASGIETENARIPVLISGGAITNSGERHEIEILRSWLVFALEESQFSRRNKLVFYHELDDKVIGTDVSLLSEIHADAVGEMKYFWLYYQPVVDTATGKTVGAEALLRWIHPEYGIVSPGRFIDFIENDPCFYRLGLSILRHAVEEAKSILKKIPEFRINVNITALQLQNDRFAEDVCDILRAYDFAPDRLVLELTERCKEMDGAFLAARISELRSRGILVAFDDLGTGYSTINLLMDIPVDEIKLDREFVKDIRNREDYQIFVRALVLGSASRDNGYTICFEGVEDEDTFGLVSLFGKFLVQGYYFSKPLCIEEFTKYIDKELLEASEEAAAPV